MNEYLQLAIILLGLLTAITILKLASIDLTAEAIDKKYEDVWRRCRWIPRLGRLIVFGILVALSLINKFRERKTAI